MFRGKGETLANGARREARKSAGNHQGDDEADDADDDLADGDLKVVRVDELVVPDAGGEFADAGEISGGFRWRLRRAGANRRQNQQGGYPEETHDSYRSSSCAPF